jgi:hypothetical protein
VVAVCKTHTNFVYESACLVAENIRCEAVSIHRQQVALKMLSLYMETFLTPAEDVLQESLQFPYDSLFSFSLPSVRELLL